MAHEGKSKTLLRPTFDLVLVMIIVCYLAPATQSYNLRKALYRNRRSGDSTTNYQEGKILFGDFFEKDQPGVRHNGLKSSSVEDSRNYQADSPVAPEDPSTSLQWQSMQALLRCDANRMMLRAKEPGASQLQLVQGDQSNTLLPLNKAPATCGSAINRNPWGLMMVVPYGACQMKQKAGCYMLPMQWQGRPIMLSCPKQWSFSPYGQQQGVLPPYLMTTTPQPTTATESTTASRLVPRSQQLLDFQEYLRHYGAMAPRSPQTMTMTTEPKTAANQPAKKQPASSQPQKTPPPAAATTPPEPADVSPELYQWDPRMVPPYHTNPYGQQYQQYFSPMVPYPGLVPPPTMTQTKPKTVANQPARKKSQKTPPAAASTQPEPADVSPELYQWDPLMVPPYHTNPYGQQYQQYLPLLYPYLGLVPPQAMTSPMTKEAAHQLAKKSPKSPPAADTTPADSSPLLYQWNPLMVSPYHTSPYGQQYQQYLSSWDPYLGLVPPRTMTSPMTEEAARSQPGKMEPAASTQTLPEQSGDWSSNLRPPMFDSQL